MFLPTTEMISGSTPDRMTINSVLYSFLVVTHLDNSLILSRSASVGGGRGKEAAILTYLPSGVRCCDCGGTKEKAQKKKLKLLGNLTA